MGGHYSLRWVFATYPGATHHRSGSEGEEGKQLLLAMSPLLDEERTDAASHSDFIKATLEISGKTAKVCNFWLATTKTRTRLLLIFYEYPLSNVQAIA